MNCPKCRSGVLEQMAILQIINGEMKYVLSDDRMLSGVKIFVCSLEQCGHTEMITTPGTLSKAKRLIRDQLYQTV